MDLKEFNQEQVILNNRVIAEHDGWVFIPTSKNNFTNEHYERGEDWCGINSFTYHKDWNALMSVVEKIEGDHEIIIDIHREATIVKHYSGEECIWKRTFWDQESKITHVYNAIVDIIKYSNKLKQITIESDGKINR